MRVQPWAFRYFERELSMAAPTPRLAPVIAVRDAIAHKTERGLVRLGLRNGPTVREAAQELLAAARREDGRVELLVAAESGTSNQLVPKPVARRLVCACSRHPV